LNWLESGRRADVAGKQYRAKKNYYKSNVQSKMASTYLTCIYQLRLAVGLEPDVSLTTGDYFEEYEKLIKATPDDDNVLKLTSITFREPEYIHSSSDGVLQIVPDSDEGEPKKGIAHDYEYGLEVNPELKKLRDNIKRVCDR